MLKSAILSEWKGRFILLKLIRGIAPKQEKFKPDYSKIYNNAFLNAAYKYYYDNSTDRELLLKTVYNGVKYINTLDIEQYVNEEILNNTLAFIDIMEHYLKQLTPNELIQIFPIRKVYDGERYQSKDYFSTMKALKKHGLDKPIGDNIDDVLWDYTDYDLFEFQIKKFSIASRLYRIQNNGKHILDDFCKENNIGTVNIYTAEDTGNQYIVKPNGSMMRIKKLIPNYLKLVK